MRDLLIDVIALVGATLMCYGAWRIYEPLLPVVAGALLTALALAAIYRRPLRKGQK